LTTFSLLKPLRAVCLFICLGFLSACVTNSKPSSANNVSFGEQPADYKSIVKTYLEKNPEKIPLDLERIDFLNEPNKFIYETFTQEKFGYRVCTMINTKSARGLRAHFFLVNNGKVIKHLQDLGLVPLSKDICDIDVLSSNSRMAKAAVVPEVVDENGFKYITCQVNDNETFFAFNSEKRQLLKQYDGKQLAVFDIEQLTDTYIVATSADSRISINRVSGTMLDQTNGIETQALCELSSKQRF
jgi:hypothetical protein